MAFVVETKRGYEIRESRATPDGPRSRTLATFREFSDEVVRTAQDRAAQPLDPAHLRAAALRAGAPIAEEPLGRAARDVLRLLAGGAALDPMLRTLLRDALGGEPEVSDAARAATQWIGAPLRARGDALRELLELGDALPPSLSKNRLSLPEKFVALHGRLAERRIPHGFGGAFAVGYYGEPRVTLDIDVNVFVEPERWTELAELLADLGIEPESPPSRTGKGVLAWEVNPVDLFFSQDRLHDAMRGATRRVPFNGTTIPIVAPEHLIVRKAILNRPKDWLDIEQILVATHPVDLPEIEAWLEAMVGEHDERLTHLREILARLGT
jgi:hypothetical protein